MEIKIIILQLLACYRLTACGRKDVYDLQVLIHSDAVFAFSYELFPGRSHQGKFESPQ